MDDVFVEKLVAKKAGAIEWLMRAAIIIGVIAVFLIFSMIQAISFLAPVALVAAVFAGWFLWSKTRIEYEYSLSNGELTVDVIYGQQRRKNLLSIPLRELCDIIAPATESYSSEMNSAASRIIDVSSSPSANRWFMNLSGEGGCTRVFFEPDERLLAALRRCVPSKIKGL